jgi:hypothetical protein
VVWYLELTPLVNGDSLKPWHLSSSQ